MLESGKVTFPKQLLSLLLLINSVFKIFFLSRGGFYLAICTAPGTIKSKCQTLGITVI